MRRREKIFMTLLFLKKKKNLNPINFYHPLLSVQASLMIRVSF